MNVIISKRNLPHLPDRRSAKVSSTENFNSYCYSSLRFTDIFVGYPGNVHAARVFSNSPLLRVHEHTGIFSEEGSRNICGVDVNALILGDSAYPVLPWLMKPFPESANMSAEKRNF